MFVVDARKYFKREWKRGILTLQDFWVGEGKKVKRGQLNTGRKLFKYKTASVLLQIQFSCLAFWHYCELLNCWTLYNQMVHQYYSNWYEIFVSRWTIQINLVAQHYSQNIGLLNWICRWTSLKQEDSWNAITQSTPHLCVHIVMYVGSVGCNIVYLLGVK